MSSKNWHRLLEIIERARTLAPEDQEAYLLEACDGDEALLAEARQVLAVELPEDFIVPPNEYGVEPLMGAGLRGLQFGEFVLEDEVGRGGMGVVYRARQENLDRTVAIKILPAIRHSDLEARQRFEREIHAVSRLSHPSIVSVITTGIDHGMVWYAMPFVDGHDLAVELSGQRATKDSGSEESDLYLDAFDDLQYVRATVARMVSLVEGVDAAHKLGIVHRDIKPSNILTDRSGHLKLLDFGLAKVAEQPTLTRSGAVQGTPHYMSPEQARRLQSPVDHRTDIYSLCVVLYELLTLKRPFDGENVATLLNNIASGTHLELRRANPSIPRDLAVICEKGMSLKPSERYDSAGELAEDLQRFLSFRPIQARPPSLWRRGTRWIERHPVLSVTCGLSILGVTGSFVLADQVEANTRVRGLLGTMQEAVDLDTWDGHELMVANATRASEQLVHEGSAGAESDGLRSTLQQRLNEDRSRRAARIKELVHPTYQRESDGEVLIGEPGTRSVVQAVRESFRATLLHGSQDLLSDDFGTVELLLTSEAEGAAEMTASARPRDPLTGILGPWTELGRLPVTARLLPGHWRVRVETPGFATTEFDRALNRIESVETLVARQVSVADANRGMILIPAATIRLDEQFACCPIRSSVDVDAFWISKTEVSNGEYLEFLNATGHAPPHFWVEVGYTGNWREMPGVADRPDWLELPATGMSLRDMQAYAEWRGLRLPTHFELEYALRGPEMLTSLPAGIQANVHGPQTGLPRTQEARFLQYVRATRPVDDTDYAQPPFGLIHAFGNVGERTSSEAVLAHEGRVAIVPDAFLYFGHAWDAMADGDELAEHPVSGPGPESADPSLGFRCVRSAVDAR